MTAHLLHKTYSVLRLSSQQNSDPCTKSDRNYFPTLHHNNAPSLLLSLSIPSHCSLTCISSATASVTHPASHAYQVCQLTNGRAGRAQYKTGQFSKLRPFTSHYRGSTHQERNNQLQHITKEETTRDCLVHDALWTGHSTAQPSTLLAALGPRLNRLQQQAHQRQATSPETHFNHEITAAIYNTILYDF
jgi:hypothetical protein